jgi:hypothetical protein
MHFGGPLDRRLRFKRPLPVTVEKENLTYIVDCQLIGQFGYGSNLAEALDDFGKTVSEMYFSLDEETRAEQLGDSLVQQFHVLMEFVEPRPRI